jgi:head-tail adaptor
MRGELSGRLRCRVIIERREDARDVLGAASGDWITMRSAWVEIAPEAVGPISEAGAKAAMGRWTVTMRFEAPLPAIGDRLLWAGRTLRVRSVIADPRTPDQLTLSTEEMR